MPQLQERQFDDNIYRDFFINYRKKSEEYCRKNDRTSNYWGYGDDTETAVLYNPLKYYMLGNYDIAYISLIDNFKSAHRLFEPQFKEMDDPQLEVFSPHTFQSFCGLAQQEDIFLKSFFHAKLRTENPARKYFLGICNLKLNNGLLIGNGLNYISEVKTLIELKIRQLNKIKNRNLWQALKREPNAHETEDKQVEFLIVQSFSWFEISLLIFTNDPEDISIIIKSLRQANVAKLRDKNTIVKKSLYNSINVDTGNGETQENKILKSGIFADTHTYVGLHADLITARDEDLFLKDFLSKNITLETEIEWQVKPGHMHLLQNMLEKCEGLQNIFDFSLRYMITGKSDYLVRERLNHVNNNLMLFRYISSNGRELFNHVRRMRTKVLFGTIGRKPAYREVINMAETLRKLAVRSSVVKRVDLNLKALKISRQIRIKILKIFSNFNNGIQDIILFPFFLDFMVFIENLVKLIDTERLNWDNRKNDITQLSLNEISVNSLEIKLSKSILVFQEGYNIRLLNGYQFEDIIDFDLDFNSSIQQLLSAYNTLAYETGKLFYTDKIEYGPIVQLNFKDTVSNHLSINYAVHHLTSPEFVYATLTKEILNHVTFYSPVFTDLINEYNRVLPEIKDSMNKKLFSDMLKSKLVNFDYYVNDAIRFVITYNMNFDLFYYWFWTYNFQNTSLYDKSGLFNEDHLRKELFRILFLKKLFKDDGEHLPCPLNQLFTYWERHYARIEDMVNKFYAKLKEHNIINNFLLNLAKRVNHAFIASGIDVVDASTSIDDFDLKDINKITSELGPEYTKKGELILRYINRKCIFKKLDDDNSAKNIPHLIYLQWYMYNYLNKIYRLNNSKVALLSRNWEDGLPLISLAQHRGNNPLYSVDQTGGLFFDDMENLNRYYQESAINISHILNYSLVQKKDFIISKIKGK